MLVEGLTQLLATNVGLKALLAPSGARSDGTNGIFPGVAPKEVSLPYIAYVQVIGNQIRTLDGTPGLQSAGIQFTCYGPSYRTAKLVAEEVKKIFSGLLTVLPDADTTSVQGAWLINEQDTQEEVPHAIIYGTLLYYEIMYQDLKTSTTGT